MDEYRAVAARCLDQLQTTDDEDSIHFPSDVTLPTMTLQELWTAVNQAPVVNTIEKVGEHPIDAVLWCSKLLIFYFLFCSGLYKPLGRRSDHEELATNSSSQCQRGRA